MTIRPGKILDEKIAFFYAIYFLTLLLSTFVLSCIGFFLGVGISILYFPFSLLLSSALFFYNVKKLVKVTAVLGHLLLIHLLLGAVFFICSNVFDTSYDGLWYHQPAILRLAEGWNPVSDPFYATTRYDESNYLWIQHYPKASWTIAASIYKMTGLIESGKMINFIAIAAVFFYAYAVFSRIFKDRLLYTLAFSLLISLSPVAASQVFSDYLDGILTGMLSLIVLSLLNMQWESGRTTKWDWFILCSALIIVTNLKFTGLFMAGIIIAVFSVYWWWKKEPAGEILKRYLLIGIVSIAAFFVFGFNPYYTNLRYKGHVFFPLNTADKYALLAQNEPVSLRERSNISKLFISVFSEAENNIQAKEIKWKNPILVSKNELRAFAGTDVRIGGLGPFFLLALLLSIPAFLFVSHGLKKDRRILLWILLSAIFLSVIFVPLAWWSRYIPQFFLLPLLVASFSCYTAPTQKNILKKYLPACVVAVLLVNLGLIVGPNLAANRTKTRLINQEMHVLRSRKTPLLINFSRTEFQALRTRLKEAGISFTDSDTLKTHVKELRSIYNLYGYGPVYNIGD